MRRLAPLFAAVALIGSTACYHATIETGATPGTDKVSIPWAHAFIYGLVPPKLVSAAAKCPRGVAKVETQMSFVNGLVGMITWGIYTPMQIDVTCAAGGGRDDNAGLATIDGRADPAKALQQAAEQSRESGQPVFVRF